MGAFLTDRAVRVDHAANFHGGRGRSGHTSKGWDSEHEGGNGGVEDHFDCFDLLSLKD